MPHTMTPDDVRAFLSHGGARSPRGTRMSSARPLVDTGHGSCSTRALVRPPRREQDQRECDAGEDRGFDALEGPEAACRLVDGMHEPGPMSPRGVPFADHPRMVEVRAANGGVAPGWRREPGRAERRHDALTQP